MCKIIKKVVILLFICSIFVDCSKLKNEIIVDDVLSYPEQNNPIIVQSQTIEEKKTDQCLKLPILEITVESLFSEFPDSPEYFAENNIYVEIRKMNLRASPFPTYYGLEPIYITGENFLLIYATDNGYEIRRVDLKGESIFSFWNPFFDTTWNELTKSWGDPGCDSKTYYDSSGWYYIGFEVDETTNRIKAIQIGQAL